MNEIEKAIDKLIEQDDEDLGMDMGVRGPEDAFANLVSILEWDHFDLLDARERQFVKRLVYEPSFMKLSRAEQANKAYSGVFYLRGHPGALLYPIIKRLLGEGKIRLEQDDEDFGMDMDVRVVREVAMDSKEMAKWLSDIYGGEHKLFSGLFLGGKAYGVWFPDSGSAPYTSAGKVESLFPPAADIPWKEITNYASDLVEQGIPHALFLWVDDEGNEKKGNHALVVFRKDVSRARELLHV